MNHINMPIKIVIPDDYQYAVQSLQALKNHEGFEFIVLGDLTKNAQSEKYFNEAQALILIRERTSIDKEFLKFTPNLKIISQTGKLARNVDINACTQAGIALVEGNGSPIAPAELTWLLIQASRRKLISTVDGMKIGLWQTEIGSALNKQVIGILGYGKIGKMIAHYAKAFDMKIQVWGSERAKEEARDCGLHVPKDRHTFFSTSDIITVHQRLVTQTQGNISLADLLAMKMDALFVNTSRAELVSEGALYKALLAGHPGYAALDVYDEEPIYDSTFPLLTMPNVLCTPHIGYVEKNSYELYFNMAINNVIRFFQGDNSHVINTSFKQCSK